MRVVRKNTSINLETGQRTDQLVGEGEVVCIPQQLTPQQMAAIREFERTMGEDVIPEIVRVMRMRQRLAQESSRWLIS